MIGLLTCLTLNWSTVLLVIVCCVTLLVRWSQDSANPPPGTSGLSGLYTFQKKAKLGRLGEYLAEMHSKYGPIISLKGGAQRMVVINDGKLMAELFQSRDFILRPYETLPAAKILCKDAPQGLLFGNGEPHDEMRRFSLLSLRDFGVGKNSIDDVIQMEASLLGEHFERAANSKDGVMRDFRIKLHSASANAIHQIICGFRHEQDNPDWMQLMKDLVDLDDINPITFPMNYFPILQKFPTLNRYLSGGLDERFSQLNSSAIHYIENQIKEHRSTYVEGDIRDFIDLYLQLESENREHYTPGNVFNVMLDLFKAGCSTVAVTLTWGMLYLIKQPETQRAIQEEIDRVVGNHDFNRHDQDKLMKTRAFLHEVNRFASIAFLSGPHTPSKPVTVKGYSIVPGDVVMGNLHYIHTDKDYWKDPESFRYERWIDSEGQLLKHEGHYYPFSTGKRGCPGKKFATIQMMLTLVHLLQNYTFEKAENFTDEIVLMDGFLRIPSEFSLKVKKRK